jgi:hypothetical protein
MKAIIDDRGYVVGIDDSGGGYELPSGTTDNTSHRYRRVNDAWVDIFPDVADADVVQAYDALHLSWGLAAIKETMVIDIKAEAGRQIEATAWKIERATEVDAADGTTTLATVYAERAAIRAASNAAEAEVNALTTENDLMSYRISF